MLRKILVALGWAAGGLVGICVVLYLVVVAVNWHDAEPSAAALRMADLHRNRPAVRDEDNAFAFIMGFDVAPSESPFEMGLKRIEWLQRSEGPAALDLSADPLGERLDFNARRDPAVREFLEACRAQGAGCSDALEAASEKFDEWERAEGWLLDRYRTLLGHASWRESEPSDIAAPLPSYGLVMDGQKLLLLNAMSLSAKHNAAGVRELLGEDLRFWRRVLESSDLLISKMIATAALNRHFKQGAAIIRALPPEQVPDALPLEWLVAITDAERSMQRYMTGEWLFTSSLIRDTVAQDLSVALVAEDTVAGKVLARLSAPLFQPQDTINRFAEHYSRVAELLEGMPLAEYEATTNRITDLSTLAARESFPPRSPYNIVGQLLIGMSFGDYGSYARRVGDIEGVRRAALAAVRLREAQVAPNNIPAALAASPLRNPYNGEPFAWDATAGVIVFRGLEPGERGEHRIH